MGDQRTYGVDLYWLPLGARVRYLRLLGLIFEAVAATIDRRRRRDIYHSVLGVSLPEGRFVIEMGPSVDDLGISRGVVAHGPVGTRWAGRFRIFRYQIRCWRDGVTAYSFAVGGARRLSHDGRDARRLLALVPVVPTPVWGRDDFGAGEMWSCNSLTSWLLQASRLYDDSIQPPRGGRAPGWRAGRVIAARHEAGEEGGRRAAAQRGGVVVRGAR